VRQRSEQLVEVQKQLIQAEKLATMGTLSGGVAHEINNPLTAILTNVQMLLADSKNFDDDSKESLELIEEATKRCRTIVQKLMTYAKKPLETAEVSRVNMLMVVGKVLSFLSFQLEQENIKVVMDAKDSQYWVIGNQNELEQVVTNIILNARDAVKQAKVNGMIHIALFEVGEWINLRIKDEGIGIPPDIISKIFDPFFTTKDVGKGLGLGLSICQSIVEKHKGLIIVQSDEVKGTVFKIKIPKAKKDSAVNTAAQ
jgi:two-component system NtrC family sensor kinase